MYDKYIVQDGESLKDLSNRFKISERDLLDINNIAFSDEIRAGKEIIVPTNTTILIHCDVERPNASPLTASYLTNSKMNLITLYAIKYASIV